MAFTHSQLLFIYTLTAMVSPQCLSSISEIWDTDTLSGWDQKNDKAEKKIKEDTFTIVTHETRCYVTNPCIAIRGTGPENLSDDTFIEKTLDASQWDDFTLNVEMYTAGFSNENDWGFVELLCDGSSASRTDFNHGLKIQYSGCFTLDLTQISCNELVVRIGGRMSYITDDLYVTYAAVHYTTLSPTKLPTISPTTQSPTSHPSLSPTKVTTSPTLIPSLSPTLPTSANPTTSPTEIPTLLPSLAPTLLPSLSPIETLVFTAEPTQNTVEIVDSVTKETSTNTDSKSDGNVHVAAESEVDITLIIMVIVCCILLVVVIVAGLSLFKYRQKVRMKHEAMVVDTQKTDDKERKRTGDMIKNVQMDLMKEAKSKVNAQTAGADEGVCGMKGKSGASLAIAHHTDDDREYIVPKRSMSGSEKVTAEGDENVMKNVKHEDTLGNIEAEGEFVVRNDEDLYSTPGENPHEHEMIPAVGSTRNGPNVQNVTNKTSGGTPGKEQIVYDNDEYDVDYINEFESEDD